MNISDGLIDRWADEAIQDLGDKGWREIGPNAMMLIIYAAQRNRDKKLVSKITKPFWWLLGTIGTGVIWIIMSSFLGL